jgi:phage recombination protein Bet
MTDTTLARSVGQQQLDQRSQRGLTLEMVVEMTGFEPAQIALISKTVAQGAPLQELAMFLHACHELRLDPLLRQAYWIRRSSGGEMRGALQVGIDGFRAIAERSGAYAGSEPPRFLGQTEITFKGRRIVVPERAQVVVWKIVQGHKAAFTGEANWNEFYPGEKDGFMYAKMPRHMLAKDAEAQALRKAFPALLGAIQQSSAIGEDVAVGDLPEVAAPPRIVEQSAAPARPQATAADYDRTIGAEYEAQDRGWTPAAAVESVRQDPEQTAPERQQQVADDVEIVKGVRSALYQELAGLLEAAAAGDIDTEPFKVSLPAPAQVVREKIAAVQQAIEAAQSEAAQSEAAQQTAAF